MEHTCRHLVAAVVVAGVVLVLLIVTVWTIAGRPVRTTTELVGEAQLLVAGAGIIVSAVLAATTIYYARQARELVLETRHTRVADQQFRDIAARKQDQQQLVAAASALIGSASDLLDIGSRLATLIRHRRIWRIKQIELAMQPVVAASKALDRMRYVAPAEVMHAGENLFDQITAYFGAASSGADQAGLTRLAREMREAKLRLNESLDAPRD